MGKYTKEEIKDLLKQRREYIKENHEYYGSGSPSRKKDYIAYKKMIQSA